MAALNTSEQIAETLLSHDIDLMKVEAGTRRKVVRMLRGVSQELIGTLQRFDPTSSGAFIFRNKKLNQVLASTAPMVDKAYAEINNVVEQDLADVAQLSKVANMDAINSVVGVELASGRLNRQVVTSLAQRTAVEGKIIKEWWSKQGKDLQDAFGNEVRDGILGGETIPDIVRRVRGTKAANFKDGIMATSTRRANALVRSSVLSVANEARFEMFKENEDVVKGMKWLSTLDGRTSDICLALSGEAWKLDGTKIGDTKLPWRGPPPAHWQCRSTLVPITRSFVELAKNPHIKAKLNTLPNTKINTLQSSMDGLVGGKLNYEAWLRLKPEAFQIEVLGPLKHKLWKGGNLSFTDLVDQSHNPLSTEALLTKLKQKSLVDNTTSDIPTVRQARADAAVALQEKELQRQATAKALADEKAEKVLEVKATTELQSLKAQTSGKFKDSSQSLAFKQVFSRTAEAEGVVPAGFSQLPKVQQLKFFEKHLEELNAEIKKKTNVFFDAPDGTIKQQAKSAVIEKISQDPNKITTSVQVLELFEDQEAFIQAQIEEAGDKIASFLSGTTAQKAAADKILNSAFGPTNSIVQNVKLIEDLIDFNKVKSAQAQLIPGYKKNIIAGKIPSPKQTAAFQAQTLVQQEKILAAIDKATTKPKPIANIIEFSDDNYTKIGGARGSNPGGLYQNKDTGEEFYMKFGMSEDMARNEVLASKLYQAADIDVADMILIETNEGIFGVAGRWIDNLEVDQDLLTSRIGGRRASEGFAVDAWLANWDAVGLEYDNLLFQMAKQGKVIRVDVGGALRYRAQGGLKGPNFDKKFATEMDTMRDVNGPNEQASSVFAKMSKEQLEASAERVKSVSEKDIDDLIDVFGPRDPTVAKELAAALKARRKDVMKRAGLKDAPDVAPVKRTATLAQEAKAVEEARSNGFARLTDGGDIEDQTVLFWEELTMGAPAKSALPATESLLGRAVANNPRLLNREFLSRFVRGVKRFRKHADEFISIAGNDDPFEFYLSARVEGLQRWANDVLNSPEADDVPGLRAIVQEYVDLLDPIILAKRSGASKGALDLQVNQSLNMTLDMLDPLLEKSTPAVPAVAAIPQGTLTSASLKVRNTLSIKLQKSVFDKDSGWEAMDPEDGLVVKEITNGHLIRGSKKVDYKDDGALTAFYQKEVGDVTVRYWPNKDVAKGLQGTVHLDARAGGEAGIQQVLNAMEELGIPTARSTAAQQERLYLSRVASSIGLKPSRTATSNALQSMINTELGILDVKALPSYKPAQVAKAFDQGRPTSLRPDLEHADDIQWMDEHHFFHRSGNTELTFRTIISEGGTFSAKTDFFRRGNDFIKFGMSPTEDLERGGANYLYTSVAKNTAKSARQQHTGFSWKGTAARRTDARWHGGDEYGRLPEAGSRTRLIPRSQELESAYRSASEALFKDGLSLYEHDFELYLDGEEKVRAMIEWLHDQGGTFAEGLWPDGRKLTQVIRDRNGRTIKQIEDSFE